MFFFSRTLCATDFLSRLKVTHLAKAFIQLKQAPPASDADWENLRISAHTWVTVSDLHRKLVAREAMCNVWIIHFSS